MDPSNLLYLELLLIQLWAVSSLWSGEMGVWVKTIYCPQVIMPYNSNPSNMLLLNWPQKAYMFVY